MTVAALPPVLSDPHSVLRPGDLCRMSFAGNPLENTDPAEHDGWGVCRECWAVLNVRHKFLPEHRIPEPDPKP